MYEMDGMGMRSVESGAGGFFMLPGEVGLQTQYLLVREKFVWASVP